MSKSSEFQQTQDAANSIETAMRSTGDASHALLEASQQAAPLTSNETSRQAINDRLIVDGEMWRSAGEIFDSSTLVQLFPTDRVDAEGAQKVADGKTPYGDQPVDPLHSLIAQSILDGREKGLFGNENIMMVRDQFDRLDAASAALEMTALGDAKFKELAGGDNALSRTEIVNTLQAGNLDTSTREALNDVLRTMGKLDERGVNIFSDNFVTLDGLKGKVSGDLSKESQAVTEMTEDAKKRLAAGGVDTDNIAPPAPSNEQPDVNPPTVPGAKEYTLNAGDGFDRVARKVYEEHFGAKPSGQQILELSEYIAKMNENDRDYSNGKYRVGDMIKVPDLSQGDAASFMESLGSQS
jgi:hypothetical protein